MSLYLDASAIVPILVRERDSATMAAVLSETSEPLVVSDFAAVEVASALSRLVRMNFLSAAAANALLGEFDAWRTIATRRAGIQAPDVQLAELFVRRFELHLRAPDALHLAACRRDENVLVTLDRRLAAAAEALGVRVANL